MIRQGSKSYLNMIKLIYISPWNDPQIFIQSHEIQYISYYNRHFSLNIFYLPIKQTKWIRHKLNKLMKSSPNYNMLQ
jgi:hypothetical protein